MSCPVHSVEPDALYVGCPCTYGGVFELVETDWRTPEELDKLDDQAWGDPLGVLDVEAGLADILGDEYEEDDGAVLRAPEPPPSKAINHGLHWTADEIQYLKEGMFAMPVQEIARDLGRSVNACIEMYNYGIGSGKDVKELARLEREKAKAVERGRWWGHSAEEMGY